MWMWMYFGLCMGVTGRPDLTFPITSLPVYPSCWFGLAAAAA